MNVRNDTKMNVDFLYYGNSPKDRNIFLSFHMNKNKGMDGIY